MASPSALVVVPVLDGLAAWAQAWPDETLYIWLRGGEEAERLTFGALWQRAGTVATALLSRWGVSRGDCVLLVYPPGLEFAVALFACFRAGVIAVPVYPPDPSKPLAQQLAALGRIAASAGAGVALSDGGYVWLVATLRLRYGLGRCWPALSWRSTSGVFDVATAERHIAAALEAAAPPRPFDVAFLQFTSGSTSEPKGVTVTHGCLAHNCALIRRAMGITAGDCEVSWLPQFHDMGLVGGMLAAVTVPLPRGASSQGGAKPMRSAPCVFMSPVDFLKDPLAWPRALSRYGATHTQAPDFAYALTAARAAASPGFAASLDLSSLRRALNGAEAVRQSTMATFATAFAPARLRPESLVAGYGLAEHVVYVVDGGCDARAFDAQALQRLGGGVAKPPPQDTLDSGDTSAIVVLHACGVPAADAVELRIVCPRTRRTLPAGAVGEIWLRSRSVAAGYWRQPQLSRDAFHAALSDEIQEEASAGSSLSSGYLRTGDLGFIHPSDGELFFVGRMKDVLVVRGRNVAPQDLEAAALAAAPALRPGCAAAFCASDDRVVLVCETRSARIDAAAAGAAAAAARLAVAALGITLADMVLIPPRTIVKTTSGKVRRFEVRRLYNEGALPALEAQPHRGCAASMDSSALLQTSLPAGLGAALSAMPRPARRTALRRRLAEHVAAITGLLPPGAHVDLLAAGLDSSAIAQLHGTLEFALGATLPPALLLDARTPAALAAALDAARWPPSRGDDADAECAAAAWEADEDESDTAAPQALQQFTIAQRCAGVAMAAFAAIALLAHAFSMTHLRVEGATLNVWREQPASIIAGAAFRSGWLPGRRVDCAHWRLLEWARTVLPIQLGMCGAFAAVTLRADASSSPCMPSPRFLTATLGLLHAMALHGVWAVPLLALALTSFAAGQACIRLGAPQLRPYAAWALALVPMAVYNAVEPGNLLWARFILKSSHAEDTFLWALLGEGGRPYEGLLAATSFTANRTFRYLALRCVSYHLDDANKPTAGGVATSLLDELELFLAYVLYAPLYLCGPVMTFDAFRASPAAAATAPVATSLSQPPAEACSQPASVPASQHVGWCAAARALCCAVGLSVALEAACHCVYLPSALLFPRFSHGNAAVQAALRCCDWAVAAFAYLTATWLTSAVVFAVPRGVAAAQRVAAPHDTPLFWTAASPSARRYWAHFHASLFAVYVRYIYMPLGAGLGALLATVAFSTFIHGFHAHWLLWGLGNAATLAAERLLARRCAWYAKPGAPVRAVNQAAAVGLMAALTMGAQLPPRGRGCVAAAIACFSVLNAVWLGK